MTKLSNDYRSLIENVKTVSFKADNNEEKIHHLVEELEKRDVKIASLADELDALRNRGMRQTIIIRGLPEGIEGKRFLGKCESICGLIFGKARPPQNRLTALIALRRRLL